MKVFLDSGVILEYLRGNPKLQTLFLPEVTRDVSYAINSVVLQELLLAGSATDTKLNIDEIAKRLEILPVDVMKSEEFLKRVRELRNRVAHANDLLILGTAQSCDYLVTRDSDLQQLGSEASIKVLSPENFLNLLEERQ